jgi:hypothetical protein
MVSDFFFLSVLFSRAGLFTPLNFLIKLSFCNYCCNTFVSVVYWVCTLYCNTDICINDFPFYVILTLDWRLIQSVLDKYSLALISISDFEFCLPPITLLQILGNKVVCFLDMEFVVMYEAINSPLAKLMSFAVSSMFKKIISSCGLEYLCSW